MADPPGLSATTPTDTALAVILRACGQDFAASLGLLLESPDPDGPRKARVALRRLTTALEAFGHVLRKSPARKLRARAKAMFRTLGELRDADVRGAAQEAEALRERVRRHLRKAKAPAFAARLQSDTLLRDLVKSGKAARAPRRKALVDTAAAALDRARRRCLRNGTDLSRLSDGKTHDLRKALKAWRYLTEFFAPCWPDDLDYPARREAFQALQDALGVLTDQALMRQSGHPVDLAAAQAAQARAQELLSALVLQGPWWRPAPGQGQG